MDSFPVVHSLAKPPRSAAGKQWKKVDSPAVVIQAWETSHNLRNVSPPIGEVQALGEYTRQLLAELGGTR